jgi:DNA-binding GntR family transcriptional regulator
MAADTTNYERQAWPSTSAGRVVTARKITRAEELRLLLADEIVSGQLEPGAALDETELARRFHVSRTPVREALRQLVASGLVDARAPRGAVVAQALCAGMAAERMSASERHALQTLHDQLRSLSYLGDPQRFHEVNEAFHNAIYAGAHNAYLAELALATRKRVQPFRRAQFRNVGRLAKSHAEHERVVLAIQQGDRTAATAAMRGHIDTVRKEYSSYGEGLKAR